MPTSQRGLFYDATRAMFFLALIIAVVVILVTSVGRLFGWTGGGEEYIYGTRSAMRSMISESLQGNASGKRLSDTVAAYPSDGGYIITTQYEKTAFPFSLTCGTEKSSGMSIFEGIIYEGKIFFLYEPFLEDGSFGELSGSTLDPETGEYVELSGDELPPAIRALTEDQIYGGATLPASMVRADETWFSTLDNPGMQLLVSEGCKTIVVANMGAVLLFGLLFLLAWVITLRRA